MKVNDVDENNVTALRFAAQYDHREILCYLLSKGRLWFVTYPPELR